MKFSVQLFTGDIRLRFLLDTLPIMVLLVDYNNLIGLSGNI